jgi:predicted N-acetyltransferase YhbS
MQKQGAAMCVKRMSIAEPRAARWSELDQLRELTDTVFWSGLMDKYPQLFCEDNVENLRVIEADGKVVSLVAMTQHWASIFGCTVKASCLGAVCTYEAYRGRGFASLLVEDAIRMCREDGVDFMLVSGTRGLYRRYGCRPVGSYRRFEIARATLPKAGPGEWELASIREEDLAQMSSLYALEPVRFVRPIEDYRNALKTQYVMDMQASFWQLRRGARLCAYCVTGPCENGCAPVLEYAGDRYALASSCGLLMDRLGADRLSISVSDIDLQMKALLESAGCRGQATRALDTVTIINPTQLLKRLQPYVEERIGARRAASLQCTEEGTSIIIELDGQAIEADRYGDASLLFFGAPDYGIPAPLNDVFPIPALWYGLSYI